MMIPTASEQSSGRRFGFEDEYWDEQPSPNRRAPSPACWDPSDDNRSVFSESAMTPTISNVSNRWLRQKTMQKDDFVNEIIVVVNNGHDKNDQPDGIQLEASSRWRPLFWNRRQQYRRLNKRNNHQNERETNFPQSFFAKETTSAKTLAIDDMPPNPPNRRSYELVPDAQQRYPLSPTIIESSTRTDFTTENSEPLSHSLPTAERLVEDDGRRDVVQEWVEREAEQRFQGLIAGVTTPIYPKRDTSRRRCMPVLFLVVVILLLGGAGLWTGLHPRRQEPPITMPPTTMPSEQPCEICPNASAVPLDKRAVLVMAANLTCMDLVTQPWQESDSSCLVGRALAWRYCGCPTTLSSPSTGVSNGACALCPRGSLPANTSRDCRNEYAYFAILGTTDHCLEESNSEKATRCGCPTELELRTQDFVRVLRSVSPQSLLLLEDDTPQHRALQWLVEEDPAQLDPNDVSKNHVIRERYIIVLFFFATDGPISWTRHNLDFLSASNVCDWHDGSSMFGVFCNIPNTIFVLSLPAMNLVGTLPDELQHLSGLEFLNLPENALVGTLPTSIGNLPVLTRIDLWNNFFTGTLPESLFLLPNFLRLEIENNLFAGPIPTSIHYATKLQVLDIESNHFTGIIPEFVGTSPTLVDVDVCDNAFRGRIPEFAPSSRMIEFVASYNQLTGPIPHSLTRLTTLYDLALESNRLTGTLPEFAGDSGSLYYLTLWNNSLSGPLDNLLLTLPRDTMETIRLDHNRFTGVLPTTLGRLTRLTTLGIGNNRALHGTIPNQIGSLSHLSGDLYLDGNALTGPLPTEIGLLTNLRRLFVQNNALSSTIPEQTFGPRLRSLYAANNRLSGILPITNAIALELLDLSENNLDGPVDRVLARIPSSLLVLHLDRNNMGGTLPNATLPLQALHLQGNRISGTIPSLFASNFGAATTLDLSTNNLFGPMPTEFGMLTNMVTLDLSNNHLNGTVPVELGGCQNLVLLNISNNDFHGDPSGALAALSSLDSLEIQGNNFENVQGLCDVLTPLSYLSTDICNQTICTCCTHCCHEPTSNKTCDLLSLA